ncbi:3'5'-cyclic nucleotide phosphodiesterase [Pelomyxa schiedti]|nr:3'5'-cyclic nucleotide phosphodiesterase [Pelomyxa schiedti]
MMLAPTDPYTFNSLVGPSLLSSLDIVFTSVYKVENTTDSLFVTVKDGNKSMGQACMGQVSSAAPVFIPMACIDAMLNCPILLQSVTGKEIVYFDPVYIDFLGYEMFIISVQKVLYSGETKIAWLYAGMEVPMLTTLLSGIDMGTNSFSYIVDSHGKLLAVLGSLSVGTSELGTVTPDNSSSTKVVHTWGLLQDKIGSISENETCKMQFSDEDDSYFLEVFHYHPHPSVQWLVVISLSSTKYTESSRLSTRFSVIITCALVAVLLVVGVFSAISLSKKRNSVSPEPKIDLDAGITKVLDKLHLLKSHSSKRTTKIIDEIISNLTQTGGLFMPDLKKQTCLLDTDIQKWLNEEIAPSKLAPDTPSNVAAPLVSVVSDSSDILELKSLDFCIFEIPPEGILERVAMQVVSSLELLQALAIPVESFRFFVHEVEQLYQANSYHNRIHAADVVQCLYYFLVNGLREIIGPTNYLDMFGLIVSGIIHDVGHPGVNNAFLIATENDLALRYNDRSVLENFHSSLGLKIMSSRVTAEWNLSPNDKKYLRSLIINLVLATDMAQHFEIISKFKTILEDPKRDMMQNKEHRTQLLCVAIKTADISNVMRPHKPMMYWVSQLTQEFYNQGDQEKALGVPVSPFTDRSEGVTKLSKLQTNFINIIAEPLLTTFSAACPTPLMIECIKSNNEYWSSNQLHHLSPSGQILPGSIPPVPSPSLTPEPPPHQQHKNHNQHPANKQSPSQSPSSKH